MTVTHILLIEDDEWIIAPLSLYLTQSGFTLSICRDGWVAIDDFHNTKPGLVILDINLPNQNGVEICRKIRTFSGIPIIMLSARESEDDKVTLLELWADDYVSKPFSSRELVARIQTIIKRWEGKIINKNSTKLLLFGDIQVDSKNFVVTLKWEEIRLTKTEFGILEYFIKNSKSVIKRENLMKDIMGYDQYLYDRTIDTHVKNLRKKLWEAINIETIRGVGYRIG